MSITLKRIWSSSIAELRPVLQKKGRDLTDNIQFDRAVVATIYFNSNMLAPVDRQWVANPQFATAAKQSTGLGDLIKTLKRPFTDKLISAYIALFEIGDTIHTILEQYRFNTMLNIDLYESLFRNPIHTFKMHNEEYPKKTFLKHIWSAVDNSIRYRYESALYLVNSIKSDYPEEYKSTDDIFNAEVDKILREAKTEVFIPSLSDAFATAAMKAATHTQVVRSSQLEEGVSKLQVSSNIFDYIDIMTQLLATDISEMERTFRCYYLYWMWDLLSEVPPMPQRDVLLARLDTLIQQYGYQEIFAEIPATSASGLSPLTGKLDPDTKAGLSRLVGEFVGRPPTREEVLARIAMM